MRKNLLKQLTLALLMTVAVPYAKSQVAHVGDILCTSGVYVSPAEYENSGLEAMAVIFYVDATGQHGWAVALEDAQNGNNEVFYWANSMSNSSNFDTPLSNYESVRAAIYDIDGQFNTQEVLAFGANINYSFPAFEVLDVNSGWYLPALGQLNYLYGNLVEVNAGLAAAGGTTFDMSSNWAYWSSTEYSSSHAWFLGDSGKLNANRKYNNGFNGYLYCRVRGVRNF